MANVFIPITSLPLLPGAPSLGMKMPIQAAGVTYQVDARAFVLPADTLLTWQDQTTALPGSRVLAVADGLTFDVSVPGVATLRVTGPISFSSKTVATIPFALIDDYNPGDWDGGLGKSSLRLTPAAGGTTLTGIDTSNMIDGQTVQLMNYATSLADVLTLVNQSVSSVATNRFALPFGADFTVQAGQNVFMVFETETNRLRILV